MFSEEWLQDYLENRPDAAQRNPDLITPDVGSDKPPRQKESGRRAQLSGRAWEKIVNNENALLLTMRLAIVQKVDAPARTIRNKKGDLQVIYEDEGPADYMGFTGSHGVAFEAKSVGNGNGFQVSKPSKTRKGNLHQFVFLLNCAKISGSIFHGYYIWWDEYQEKRWHYLDSFTPGGYTTRAKGIPTNSWWEQYQKWKLILEQPQSQRPERA